MARLVEAVSVDPRAIIPHRFFEQPARVMNEEQQLKLQAFLDGELPEKEASEVASWLARDKEATDLAAELRNTRKALADFEPDWKLPETREFYWSKIEREIRRLEADPAPAAVESASTLRWLRRFLIPISAAAVLGVAGFFGLRQFSLSTPAQAVQLQTTFTDAGAFTYCDQAHGLAVVWFTYPAEKAFTPTAPGDTVQ